MRTLPAEKKEGAAAECGALPPICPQCLHRSDIDCTEAGCPGVKGFVPHAVALASMKTCQGMGRRIKDLEDLVLQAAAYPNRTAARMEEEAARIRGRKKEGARS